MYPGSLTNFFNRVIYLFANVLNRRRKENKTGIGRFQDCHIDCLKTWVLVFMVGEKDVMVIMPFKIQTIKNQRPIFYINCFFCVFLNVGTHVRLKFIVNNHISYFQY